MTTYADPGKTMTTQAPLYGVGDYPSAGGAPQPGMPAPQQPPSNDAFTLAAQAQGAQGTANVNAQTVANRANQTNPYGSSQWTMDPRTGQWTQNVSLDSQSQQALDSQQGMQASRSAGAAGMLPGAIGSLGQPIDSSGFHDYFSFGSPGATNARAEEAMMSRLNPMMASRRAAMETQLANQGITRGSEAWRNAQDQMGRDENDARFQGIKAGFEQGNSEAAQNINYGDYQSRTRGTQFGEADRTRTQGLRDVNSLMEGQGVTAPSFGQYGQAGVAAAPNYLGASQSGYNAMLDSQNASADEKASLYKSLFGLGGAALDSQIGQQLLSKGGDYLTQLFGLGGGGSRYATLPGTDIEGGS